MDRPRDQLLSRAALALDEHRRRGVDDAVEGPEEGLYCRAPAEDLAVIVAVLQRLLPLAHVLGEALDLRVLAAEQLLDALPLLRELARSLGEIGVEPGVGEGDGHLIGEAQEQIDVVGVEEASLKAVVEVERAEHAGGAADGRADHGFQAHRVD